MADGTSQI